MRATVYDWCGAAYKKLADIGHPHNEVLDLAGPDDLWKVVREIFDSGLAVLVIQDKDTVIIGVDTRGGRFRTR